MKFFGIYIGKVRTLEERIRQRMDDDIRKMVESLVGSELRELQEKLKAAESGAQKLTGDFEKQTRDYAALRIKYDQAKAGIAELSEKLDETEASIRTDLIESAGRYILESPGLVCNVVGRMVEENKRIPYLRSFFGSLYKIDELVTTQTGEHPGLQVLEAVVKGSSTGSISLENARAFSLYVRGELERAQPSDRQRAYDYFMTMAREGDFGKALERYRKEAIHRDYVLNLTETERDLLRMRDQRFNGSWAMMLSMAKSSTRETRALSLRDEPVLSVKFIEKLMDYEQRNSVRLAYVGKDF